MAKFNDSLIEVKKGTTAWYRAAFKLCEPDANLEGAVNRAAMKVLSGRLRYIPVAEKFGFKEHDFADNFIPFWAIIGTIHYKECTCDFKGVLHNGERIVGTGRKTKLVPVGRGPFATWEEAAKDAIKHDGLNNISDFSVGNILKLQEAYNGIGYLKYHPEENSPYLWASSNINDDFGKYVADGKYDKSAPTNKTVGAAVILKELFRTLKMINATGGSTK